MPYGKRRGGRYLVPPNQYREYAYHNNMRRLLWRRQYYGANPDLEPDMLTEIRVAREIIRPIQQLCDMAKSQARWKARHLLELNQQVAVEKNANDVANATNDQGQPLPTNPNKNDVEELVRNAKRQAAEENEIGGASASKRFRAE